jgi:hypothetical protein
MRINSYWNVLTGLLLSVSVIRPDLVYAQADSWSNPNSGTWKWETNSNWSLSAPPGNLQDTFITNAPNAAAGSRFRIVDVDLVTIETVYVNIGNLTISGVGSGVTIGRNSLILDNYGTIGGAAMTVNENMSITANGSLTVTNAGVVIEGGLFDDNTVFCNGGLIQTAYSCGSDCGAVANTWIGYNGIGSFVMNDGEWDSGPVQLGTSLTTYGTLTISAGTFNLYDELDVMNGTVWLTGGTVERNYSPINMVGMEGGAGQMIMSNGLWSTGAILVGNSGGTGTVTFGGGSASFSALYVGNDAASVGAVWGTGGQVSVTDVRLGVDNTGQMTLSNGTVISSTVEVGFNPGSSGKLTVAGGDFEVSDWMYLSYSGCSATGTLNITGGSLNVTNSSHTAFLEVDSGTLTLSGGTLRVDKLILTNSCGHFVQTGGTLVVGGVTNLFSPSPFQITSIVRTNASDLLITWNATGATNIVQIAAGTGVSGSFSTNGFTDLTTIVVTTYTTNFWDVGAATNRPARYYRIFSP